ncbi:MAG TPA: MTH1187 family thiamine-binding protein [Ornithinimicrobium sp.]|uniref:MTH1187 family thiamine-binding protein n=1 Tax=Ornithinimicrobium sp. TaxID=1977084 RepID=UPI002B46D4EE|nr:MTH1187 family thiamine-binding protein [Ornithinimicrobium sp.]HKJ11512.1 MTH1187 family thiamine-binding protein [Ornithinimicrobium sp.]
MIAAFSVAPMGHGDSVSGAVTEAVRVVRDSGLSYRLTSMFTEVEGDWDEVFDVIRRATEAAGSHGGRVSLVIKADIRPGWSGQLTEKVTRVTDGLDEDHA